MNYSRKINPDRLHTLELPLSNGRKPDYKDNTVDRNGKTEYERWVESGERR